MKKQLILWAAACAVLTSNAAVLQYSTSLSGAVESPPNASPGVGTAWVEYNDALRTLRVQASFSGLIGNTTAAHIHGPTAVPGTGTAGVMTTTPNFAGFPVGVTSGAYDNTLDLTLASSYNAAFVTANGGTTAGAEAALAAGLAAGRTYLNLHSTAFPGGEIRGFLTLVPEPSSFAVLGLGTALLAATRRRKQAA
jgi:hypothetical protein